MIDDACHELSQRLNMVSLCEFAEGYHRQTHITLRRSPISKTPWILAKVRCEQNFRLATELIEKPGGVGLFSYLWANFKGLLQKKSRFKRTGSVERVIVPVKCTKERFSERFYRMDESAVFDWGQYLDIDAKHIPRNAMDVTEKLHFEYLRDVMKIGEYYSVEPSADARLVRLTSLDASTEDPALLTHDHRVPFRISS